MTFQPALVFGTVSLIYFLLCWPLSLYAQYLERRLLVGMEAKNKPIVVAGG